MISNEICSPSQKGFVHHEILVAHKVPADGPIRAFALTPSKPVLPIPVLFCVLTCQAEEVQYLGSDTRRMTFMHEIRPLLAEARNATEASLDHAKDLWLVVCEWHDLDEDRFLGLKQQKYALEAVRCNKHRRILHLS